MEISKVALVPRTVSSNRSFSYAIFKRRIHNALTTIRFQEFFHFLFIYSSLYIYIYTRRAKYIIIDMVLPMVFFFSLLFFFFPICHGSKHLFLLRIEAHDLIDSSALLTFFLRRLAFDPCFTDFIKQFCLTYAPSTFADLLLSCRFDTDW